MHIYKLLCCQNERKLGSERTKLGSERTKLGSERTFIVCSEPSKHILTVCLAEILYQ